MRMFLTIGIVLWLLAGCNAPNRQPETTYRELTERLEVGDLLFRRGTGFVGQVVTSLDREGNFSHVGLVVRSEEGWQVIHAVPHEPEFKGDIDRVKSEEVARFLGRYPHADFGLYRPQIEKQQRERIARNAVRLSRMQVPFDHDYDLSDTTRLYCTELVEYLFGLEGITLSEGRRTEISFPSLSGSYIFPSDLTQSNLLKPIY